MGSRQITSLGSGSFRFRALSLVLTKARTMQRELLGYLYAQPTTGIHVLCYYLPFDVKIIVLGCIGLCADITCSIQLPVCKTYPKKVMPRLLQ